MRRNIQGKELLKLAFACLILLCSYSRVDAQIIEQASITDLIERWKTYNLDNAEVSGWRIQLLATVDRRQVEKEKRIFENKYPDYPTHMVNNQPYFHLKTGAFLTMQKAQAFLKKLQHDYPGAIIVEDLIKTDEMLLYDQ
ncbi:MAG: SPOR domain-containing protein [Saprospiraceae bacterium]